MLEQMQLYFSAEKSESLVFLTTGLVALLSGIVILAARERFGYFLQGFAGPLAAVAMIQVVVGANVYLRTDSQVAQLRAQFQQAPAEFKVTETARMKVVNKNFAVYKRVEIGLLLLGVACAALGFARERRMLAGVGAGLVIQSGLMLVLDFLAEARADVYTAALFAL